MRGCRTEVGAERWVWVRAEAFSGELRWVGVRWVGYGVGVNGRNELAG